MSLAWKIAQKAERKWWQIYLKNKEVAAYTSWKLTYWKTLLDTISDSVSIQPTNTVLDAGCGPAGIFMASPDHNLTAIDPLIDMYETDLPHFKRSNYPNVNFKAIGIEDFADEKQYDLIFCMNAINHVSDIKKGYANLAKLLKTKGKLVISIDVHNHSFFKYLFRILPGDILHPCQYDLDEYAAFLTNHNMAILKTEKLKSGFFFDYYVQVAEKN